MVDWFAPSAMLLPWSPAQWLIAQSSLGIVCQTRVALACESLTFFRRYGDNSRRTSYAVHLWEIQAYTVSSGNLVGQKFVAHAWPFCAWARCAAHLASVTIAVVRSVAITAKRYATSLVPKFSHA